MLVMSWARRVQRSRWGLTPIGPRMSLAWPRAIGSFVTLVRWFTSM